MKTLAYFALLLVFFSIGRSISSRPTDNSDVSADQRSGLKIHTDNLTGCQYFSSWSGALTPRLAADGVRVVGCKN